MHRPVKNVTRLFIIYETSRLKNELRNLKKTGLGGPKLCGPAWPVLFNKILDPARLAARLASAWV